MYTPDRKSQYTMGCEYRARTGACSCPNPPYGCIKDGDTGGQTPQRDGFKISFPMSAKSYGDLRTGGTPSVRSPSPTRGPEGTVYNAEGIPVGYRSKSPTLGSPSSASPSALSAPPLHPNFKVEGLSSKDLPSVGWQCTGDDAGACVRAGFKYIDCAGDKDAEKALAFFLKTAETPRDDLVIGTSIAVPPSNPALGVPKAAKDALACLGIAKLDLLCLMWDGTNAAGDANLAAAWTAMGKLLAEGLVGAVGLRCRHVSTAKDALNAVARIPNATKVAVLQTVMHPLVPKVQRNVLGLCRRNRCQMIALDPLSSSEDLARLHEDLTNADSNSLAGRTVAEVLLAYNIGRGVAVLPSAANGGVQTTEYMGIVKQLRPLNSAHRAALDSAAPQA